MKNRILLLLSALMLTTMLSAQNPIYLPWEFAGGPPCPINDVVLHNGILYAATDCGLYRRPESGGTWEQQPNTPDSTVLFIAANAGAIVAVFNQVVTNGSLIGNSLLSIFNSTDNGASFTQRYSYDYNYFAYYPPHGASNHTDFVRLYALGDSAFVLTANSCDYGCRYIRTVSVDNGQNWVRNNVPNYFFPLGSLLNPYAVQGDTVASFNFDSLELVATSTLQHLSSVKIPPTITGQAVGLTWVNGRITVAFRSGHYAYTEDLGQTWTMDSLLLSNINDFFYSENNYYWCTDAGFYRSAEIGPAALETLYTRPGPLGAISQAIRGDSAWYLLANGVLLLLPDGTNAASPVNTAGMDWATGTLSSLPNRLLFLNAHGLWWQSMDGATWSVEENEPIYTLNLQNFYVGDTFSLAIETLPNGQNNVYRSVDGGTTWALSLSNMQVQVTSFFKNQYDTRVYGGPYFTADGGLNWDTLNASPTAALGDTLVSMYGGISFNHGQTWQGLTSPDPLAGEYSFNLANRTVWAMPKQALSFYPTYRSLDFGTTWESIGTADYDAGAAVSEHIGHATWLRNRKALYLFPDPGQAYFKVAQTPFSIITPYRPGDYPHPEFGQIIQKDSTIYAAYNGGVWRVSNCYAEYPFSTPPQDSTICQGNFVLFHGDTLRTAGTYLRKIPGLTTVCDSIDVLRLQVDLIAKYWNQKICAGDTLLWNGQAYTELGAYTQQFSTPTSCDSTVTLYLNYYSTTGWSNLPFCNGDVIVAYGDTISAIGQYTYHLTSFNGCDSTLMLNVYDAQDTFHFSPIVCAGAGYSLFGHTFTETGEYWFTRVVPTNPCPSTYHISLTVKPDEVIALDTFVTVGTVIYGHTINSDTIFTVLVAGPSSCDKIVTITVHTTVGTDNLNAEQAVQAFPNPFRDQLTLRWPGGASAQVRLYDTRGRLLREAQLAGPTAVWNTGDLPTGLYRVEIMFAGKRYAWEVVKMP